MTHRTNKQGFTLIELLVVMAIIAILAAILVPLAPKLIGTAKRNKAKGEVATIAMAVKQYYNDYGRMPATGPSHVASEPIIKTLIANDATKNPRNTVYLELETSNITGQFYDPWGNQYALYLDDDYNGKVVLNGGTFTTSAICVSNGPDGTANTADDIKSVK